MPSRIKAREGNRSVTCRLFLSVLVRKMTNDSRDKPVSNRADKCKSYSQLKAEAATGLKSISVYSATSSPSCECPLCNK